MKKFEEYQYLDGEPMTDRDKQEIGSKFWNSGKWDNFVAPFLPKDCQELTLIDIGCNAGLFLKLAENMGFGNVIGVDSNEGAVKRGLAWRDKNGGKYQIKHLAMEECLDKLPMADYTILANTHYYFKLSDWLKYVEKLKGKTRYCIIVTAKKKPVEGAVASDVESIREYFKDWEDVGFVDVSLDGDPYPRELWGLCFKSHIERVPIDILDNGNAQQKDFLEELDQGKNILDTHYYRRLKSYRKRTTSKQTPWTNEQLITYMQERLALYNSMKTDRLIEAIEVGKNNRIVDGNHRHAAMKHLGYKTILIKRV